MQTILGELSLTDSSIEGGVETRSKSKKTSKSYIYDEPKTKSKPKAKAMPKVEGKSNIKKSSELKAFFEGFINKPLSYAEEIRGMLKIANMAVPIVEKQKSSKSNIPKYYKDLKSILKISKLYDDLPSVERNIERKKLSEFRKEEIKRLKEENKKKYEEKKKSIKKTNYARDISEGKTETIKERDERKYLESEEVKECNVIEEEKETKYSSYLSTYIYTHISQDNEDNLQHFMDCVLELGRPRVVNFLQTNGSTKFFYAYNITFRNTNDDLVSGAFYSNIIPINNTYDVTNAFIKAEQDIWDQIEKFNSGGSGKIIENINSAYINLGVWNPTSTIVGRSYIELPKDLKKSKGLCNIKNEDNECFRWSVLARLYQTNVNKNKPSTYMRYYDELKFPSSYKPEEGFAPYGPEMDEFEEANNLSISIFQKSKKYGVTRIRLSKIEVESKRTINLLLLRDEDKIHYVLITNFEVFMSQKGRQMFHCRLCMTGFTTEKLLEKHKSGDPCITIGDKATKIVLPEEGYKLKFRTEQIEGDKSSSSEWKTHRYPIAIYCDTESNLIQPIDIKQMQSVISDAYYDHNTKIGGSTETKLMNLICDYACIELCNIKSGDTIKKQYHKMISYNYHVVFSDECKGLFKPKNVLYRGENAGENFLKFLRHDCNIYKKIIKENDEKFSYIPKKMIKIPIFMHNLSGYDSHLILLELAKVCNKPSCIPKGGEKFVSFEADGMVFKDSISFLSASLDKLSNNLVQKWPSEVKGTVVPSSKEVISEYETRGFKQTREYYKKYGYSYEKIRLLTKKGLYPYDYFTSFEKFEETELPPAEAFVSALNRSIIDGVTYEDSSDGTMESALIEAKAAREKAVYVFKTFGCKNNGDYSDLYLRTDTLLLADVFEAFRDTCMREYGLDPVNYYTLPGYAWDCCLKKSGIELEVFVDGQIDMLLFVEKCIRGGISMISNRYGKADNIYTRMEENKIKDSDRKTEHIASPNEKFIIYYDANGLYSNAMCQYLPYGGYKWSNGKSEKAAILESIKVTSMKKMSVWDIGHMLEINIKYDKSLHDLHNDYPCAPQSKTIENSMLSPHAIKLKYDIAKLQLKRRMKKESKLFELKKLTDTWEEKGHEYDNVPISKVNTAKLICDLNDKKRYVVHYRTLKTYMDLGLEVTKVHRILSFNQKPWMKSFIEANIKLRKAAKNEFEKCLYKLMNNAVFGKTMENVRKRKEVSLVTTQEELKKKLNKFNCGTWEEIKGGLIIINMNKEVMKMDKPIIVGAAILDLSKTTMYDFHYNTIKAKYGDKAKLLFTDTDSLCYEIILPSGGNLYKDIYEDRKFMKKLDTACYKDVTDPNDYRYKIYNHKKYGGVATKGCIGLFKDVMADDGCKMAIEFAGLRAKMYSLKMLDNITEKSTAKGVKTKAKKNIKHQKYLDCLFGSTLNDRCQMINFNVIRSHKHQLYTESVSKVSLSASDDKFYMIDDVSKLAYGHYKISENQGSQTLLK